MRDTKIRKRPDSVKGVIEGSSLVKNSRVPESVGCARITRSGAVTARAPGPLHCIAWVNRHRCRHEAEAIVANRDRDRDRARHPRAESQKRSDDQQQYRNAYWKGFHRINVRPHNCKPSVAARKTAKVTMLLPFRRYLCDRTMERRAISQWRSRASIV